MVVETQPKDFYASASVIAFSDAADNFSAIRELDHWARENGFVRGREYTLNVKQDAEGRRVYYGVCYRLTAADHQAAEADMERIRQRRAGMALTPSSDELLQEA